MDELAQPASHYRNPILPGFHPDPSICRAGEDYFLVTSSFEYYPGVPLFHSRDLAHWRPLPPILRRPGQLRLEGVKGSDGIFAPTIRYHRGRFYMVTTNIAMGGNFLVWTDDPFGDWSEPMRIDQGGIDPSLLFDDDGRVYLVSTSSGGGRDEPIPPEFGRWAVVQSEIDLASGQRLSPTRALWSGTGGKYPEGPHLYRIGDLYYLLLAEGGTEYGHMVTVARSRLPWGPFDPCPHNPILTHRSIDHPVQGTGHADLVQAQDGSWWMVCLGFRPNPHDYPARYHLGRETCLAPVRWTEGGWPQVGANGTLEMEGIVGGHTAHLWPADPAREEFDAAALGPVWCFLRNPADADWSLTARPGWLQLCGAPASLDERGPTAWVGRRQQHFACRAAALIDFDPVTPQDEAGLTVRMDDEHHYELAITQRNGQRVAVVKKRIGSLVVESTPHPLPRGPLELMIEADACTYRFGWAMPAGALPGGALTVVDQAETRYVTTEVAGTFTGVFLAMYATGNGARSHRPAAFDWFEYTGS